MAALGLDEAIFLQPVGVGDLVTFKARVVPTPGKDSPIRLFYLPLFFQSSSGFIEIGVKMAVDRSNLFHKCSLE